jgi:hypothetical protein
MPAAEIRDRARVMCPTPHSMPAPMHWCGGRNGLASHKTRQQAVLCPSGMSHTVNTGDRVNLKRQRIITNQFKRGEKETSIIGACHD